MATSDPRQTGELEQERGDQRISHESLADHVARRLTDLILAGEFTPGARLPEPEIAARFGVSRGPVREAFHLLARDGLVQFRPRRGVVVTELTAEETHEIYELRGLMFGHACRLAATHADERQQGTIRRALEALHGVVARGAELAQFLEARNRLVASIYSAADNRTLIAETERLNRRALLHHAVFNREARRQESIELWTRVVEAVASGDGEAAATAGVAMVESAEREVLRIMGERGDVRSRPENEPS